LGRYVAVVGSDTCIVCETGTYNAATGSTEASACIDCPRGTYAATAGSSICTQCGPGQYQSLVGATAPMNCAPGTVSGAEGAEVCQTCIDPSACPGGGCAAGHTGYLCAACSDGFYRLNGGCTVCSNDVTSTAIAICVLVLLLALVYRQWQQLLKSDEAYVRQVARQANVLSIILAFLQTVAISTKYALDWPPDIQRVMDWIGSVVMLDLFTFVVPECTLKIGFIVRWVIQMVLPLILIGVAVQKTRRLAHEAVHLQERSDSEFYSTDAKSKFKEKSENAAQKKDALEQLSTTVLLTWYLTMLNKSTQPMACSRVEGAVTAVLDADPTIRCWGMGGSHMFIAIIGILTFTAFGVVLPYILRESIIRAASIKFVGSWEWFEYAMMAQKLVTAISLTVPQKQWLLQWLM
jgi:hypothetical protein